MWCAVSGVLPGPAVFLASLHAPPPSPPPIDLQRISLSSLFFRFYTQGRLAAALLQPSVLFSFVETLLFDSLRHPSRLDRRLHCLSFASRDHFNLPPGDPNFRLNRCGEQFDRKHPSENHCAISFRLIAAVHRETRETRQLEQEGISTGRRSGWSRTGTAPQHSRRSNTPPCPTAMSLQRAIRHRSRTNPCDGHR